ncbi:HNH endonuclease [Yersinia mollaretii]|uniref:HNH endonuclease n=1 Tax=Yersinia mollaretii TaxID=33060 RepID=UPI000C15BB3F|nr:HNH endonuclease [Yersinia mollaretii]MDA5529085.1 HNH endonuclease [Yersinia mollaretii]MDR7875759.1 HNH endonuclease [Yersinia mollaretii]PHZ29636.1 hypothetical protein CS537_21455 [Yersinia mollaretii]WQC76917.1 HNH endonuclease [Yersinia mollaretii]
MRRNKIESIRDKLIKILQKYPKEKFSFYAIKFEEMGLPTTSLGTALNNLYKSKALIREGKRGSYIYEFTEPEEEKDPYKKRENITPEFLISRFIYDPETGSFKRKHCSYKRLIGTDPCFIRGGYSCISIKGNTFLSHRVAWAMSYGQWPKEFIDHINGVRNDNRLINLREATSAQNNHNVRAPVKSKTGFRGVDYMERKGKWRARIKINGKVKQIGTFNSPEDAGQAYASYAKNLRGEFYKEPI